MRRQPRNRKTIIAFGLLLSLAAASLGSARQILAHDRTPREAVDPLAWPRAGAQTRPWAYWWWMGSAVDEKNLTWNLQQYRQAGYGGVHAIPIYGAKGYEDRYVEYLSPRWMALLRHAVSEAQRLGMQVDMTTGTGWCFGGPNVSVDDACAKAVFKTVPIKAGEPIRTGIPGERIQAAVAFGASGRHVDLTGLADAEGKVSWDVPDGQWTLYLVSQKSAERRVKRPAPGGEGYMLNPFSKRAITRYLERFEAAFQSYAGPRPRAMYHDSYEYICDWSPELFADFQKYRGYRLQDELPALFGRGDRDRVARVKYDYRRTVSEMILHNFTQTWVDWCHRHGFLTRDQAHGSPANLLDLYGACDIPETEFFREQRDVLFAKISSSAAHVMGRTLVAAETGTWLEEHFRVTLAKMKVLVDDLFLSGVNHIIYHGTCYSPREAPWPGWVFYASTQMNPRNSIWHDAPALNAYITRCQSVLQAGRPDNDVLVYWAIHDLWQQPDGLAQKLIVDRFDEWMGRHPTGRLVRWLRDRGFAFDYVSDRQLLGSRVEDGAIVTPGGQPYRVVMVPQCELMPPATLRRLIELATSGGTVIFQGRLPADVPGLGRLEERRDELTQMRSSVRGPKGASGLATTEVGQGRILVGDREAALVAAGVARESLVDQAGLEFLRRRHEHGRYYLVVNRGQQRVDGWIPLAASAATAILMDPMTGQTGVAALRERDGGTHVYVQLEPNASVIVKTLEKQSVRNPRWTYAEPSAEAVELHGRWHVEFIAGGPTLPEPFETERLESWTKLGGPQAERFAGTARYRLHFDAPAGRPDAWLLDLGRVEQSARVRLNGCELATVIIAPFQVRVDAKLLKPKGNVLEIDVTNLAANRIRDLDRRKAPWKTFHNINFVSRYYRPFDASDWPILDSGLLGPVRLVPLRRFESPE